MPRPIKYGDAEILDRASNLLWLAGPDCVTIRDLEAALDLKAPSLYRRFGAREGLVAQAIEHYVEQVVGGRVRHFLDRAEDPIAGLRAFFTSALEPLPGESGPRGCLLTVTAGQEDFENADVRTSVSAGLMTIEQGFRRALEQAQVCGQLRDDANLDALAALLLVSFEGLLVLARSGRAGLGAAIEQLFAGLPLTG